METIHATITKSLTSLEKSVSHSTWLNYSTTARLVSRIMSDAISQPVSALDENFVLTLVSRLRALGDSENTVCFHLRNFRALVNDILVDKSVFRNVHIRPQKTRKRSLDDKQLRQLIDYKPKGRVEERAKDVFLLILLLNGTALVDLVYINNVSLSDGYLDFCRHKTHVHVTVPLNDISKHLVEKYKSSDSSSPYLFSFLDGCSDKESQYRRYRSVMRAVNNGLHKIEKALGFDFPLTAYCARHSFASVAKLTGNSVDNIRTCLGHTASRTTEIYLRQLDKTIETKVNTAVTNHLFGKGKFTEHSVPLVIIINNSSDITPEIKELIYEYLQPPSIQDRGK